MVVPILPHASPLERLLAIAVAEMRTVVGAGPPQPISSKSAMALLELIGELAAMPRAHPAGGTGGSRLSVSGSDSGGCLDLPPSETRRLEGLMFGKLLLLFTVMIVVLGLSGAEQLS